MLLLCNRMRLNRDKTAILVVTSSKDDRDPTSITLKTEDDKIVQSQRQIKVLGWLTNGSRSMDSQLNASLSKIHFCYIKYASITKFMPEKLRANLARTCILSILTYGLEFYFAQNVKIISKLQVTFMNIARWVKMSYCFRMRKSAICQSINWEDPYQLMLKGEVH